MAEQIIIQIEMNYIKIITIFKKVNKEIIMNKIEYIHINSKGKKTFIMKYPLKI